MAIQTKKCSFIAIFLGTVICSQGLDDAPGTYGDMKTVSGVPVYNSDLAQTNSVTNWLLSLSVETSSAEVHHLCSNLPGDATCTFQGHASEGVVPMITLRASELELGDILAAHGQIIAFAEPDGEWAAIEEDLNASHLAATSLPWGLDRVDDRLGLDGAYKTLDDTLGQDVHVYVLDTGIRTTHDDFKLANGRSRAIPTLESLGTVVECRESDKSCAADRQGHGTHCAGSIGGKEYGVAKGATLHAVKCLSDRGGGRWSWFVSAVNWVASKGKRPAVISASLGGSGRSATVEKAVNAAVAAGVTVVVAAGNDSGDACTKSPAFVPSAITVGATDKADKRASWSNYGKCLDLFAPGVNILSASKDSDRATKTLSGTSMACPHVAGGAALLLERNPKLSPSEVSNQLSSRGTHRVVQDAKPSSPNLLLYVGEDDGDTNCYAEVYQHGNFAGWSASFPVGDYDADAFVARGARSNDASSIKVFGSGCKAILYGQGDFTGWEASFETGIYDFGSFLRHGGKNDDASSLRVVQKSMSTTSLAPESTTTTTAVTTTTTVTAKNMSHIEGLTPEESALYNPELSSYWDRAHCGLASDNHNLAWCWRGALSKFRCQSSVTVDQTLCSSGGAVLSFKHQFARIDGCAFAYYAQYECKAPTTTPAITTSTVTTTTVTTTATATTTVTTTSVTTTTAVTTSTTVTTTSMVTTTSVPTTTTATTSTTTTSTPRVTTTPVPSTTTVTTSIVTTTTVTTVTTTTTYTNTVTTTAGPTSPIRSGDTIFLKTQMGHGAHIDVEGATVQARWQSMGNWQAIVIEREHAGILQSGDTVYLKAHTGKHIHVQEQTVRADWNDHGSWQAMTIEKRTGSGAIVEDDLVCFKAHTGKHLDAESGVVRARWEDCGALQTMLIQKSPHPSVTTSTVTTTTATTVTTTTTYVDTVTTTGGPSSPIRSGDTIFLKTQMGHGAHIDVEDATVQARWQSMGNLQAIVIEREHAGTLQSGDTVYLKAHTGKHIHVQEQAVRADWNEHGGWQAMTIEKRSGSGAIFDNDLVCFKAHTGKHLDAESGVVRARWEDCGALQTMQLQKEVAGALSSGDSIHLLAHTGKLLDVEGTAVRARWTEAGLWQTFQIRSYGGRAIYSGDVVFVEAHTGAFLDVQGTAVQARWKAWGDWQKLVISKAGDGAAIMPGDTIFLQAHTGKMLDVEGDTSSAVRARYADVGGWQSLIVEKAADGRRLKQTAVDKFAIVMV